MAEEELHWFQKSKAKWLYMGDHNTKYFHGITTIRRKRNKHDMLKDENGNWIFDTRAVESLVTNFYKDLYLDNGIVIPYVLNNAFPPLEENWINKLSRMPTNEEIHQTIKFMGSLKAPKLDGFHVLFFEHHWSVVGRDVYNFTRAFF